ncbi:MAG: acetyl-CoA C-acetyltransferase, partial [Myxococcota bacterium]
MITRTLPSHSPQEHVMQDAVVVGYARTPIGKFGGGLSSFSAMDLGGFAIKAALARAGVAGEDVGYVVMGHVLQAGQGQITSRQAALN